MTHKAFEVIGERVLIVDPSHRNKEGIFQESREFQTTAEGAPRPALDFIEPRYQTNPNIEEWARGKVPQERVNLENPLLNVHQGVDQLKLRYEGKREGTHVFEGELSYERAAFFNDGHSIVFDMYGKQLKRAGFKIGKYKPS